MHPGAFNTMPTASPLRLALLYPGDAQARCRADPEASRFAALFQAFAAAGVHTEPAVYHDDFAAEVKAQLLRVDGVLVWCNPIEAGLRRERLDTLLREVANAGVMVSTHPDTILKLGTKDVLLATRDLPFGSDVQRIDSLAQLLAELPTRLRTGARVLKQHRGHSGQGVWRVQWLAGEGAAARYALQQAQRGSEDEGVDLPTLAQRLAPYFETEQGGHMVDQAWQPGLAQGMTRAYLVGDQVAGFGHQAVNALFPAAPGQAAPAPGPRLYHGADEPAFQPLRQLLQGGWIEALRQCLNLAAQDLPLLWDCDFIPRSPASGKNAGAEDTGDEHIGDELTADIAGYVLCEINVSSVSPFPPSCIVPLVAATQQRLLDKVGARARSALS